jgi:hypothetical protein
MPIYASGIVIANGFNVDAGNDGGVGIISWLVNGAVSLNGATIAHFDSSSFKSTGACELRLENIQWIGRPTAPYSLFSGGTVREDDYFYNTTVSGLPTASAIFKGLRASVTDGAASLAWGATVTGGGSAFYEVVCNGSVWTVTGK